MNFTHTNYKHNSTYTLSDILNGFSNKNDIKNFIKNNKIGSSIEMEYIFKLILTERLSKLNINIDTFNNFLRKHHAKLTGSFLLQVISDESYDCYDIDIYVDKIDDFLKNDVMMTFNATFDATTNESVLKPNNHKYITQIVKNVKNFSLKSFCSTNGFKKPLKIQLIETSEKYKGIEKYIDTFDFDILKNYYDGNNFYITNLKGIQTKCASYNDIFIENRPFIWIIGRIKKYHARGFTLNFGFNFLNYAKNIVMDENNITYYPKKYIDAKPIRTSLLKTGLDYLLDLLDKNNNCQHILQTIS